MHLRKGFAPVLLAENGMVPVHHPRLNSLLSSIRHSGSLPSPLLPNTTDFVNTLSCRTPNHAELSAWVLLAERPILLVVDEAVLPGSDESLRYRNPMPSN